MASYHGSGKYVKIERGRFSFGINGNVCSSAFATTSQYEGYTYYGMMDSSLRYINLTSLSELTLWHGVGYTGTVRMCTEFTCPYQILLEEESYANIVTKYKTAYFSNGFCTGVL